MHDLFNFCDKRNSKGFKSTAFLDTLSSQIILCPEFFIIPELPPPDQCRAVNKYQSNFYDYNPHIPNYQLWHLMHEVAHFYIHDNPEEEAYLLNECLRLNAIASVNNAENYIFYAASMFFPRTIRSPTNLASNILISRHSIQLHILS